MSDYESHKDCSGGRSCSCQSAGTHPSRGIHIVNKGGTVNVRTGCAAMADHSKPEDGDTCSPYPPLEGTCVPPTPGSKPKQRRQQKLDRILERSRVKSALTPSFLLSDSLYWGRVLRDGKSRSEQRVRSHLRILRQLFYLVRVSAGAAEGCEV